MAFWKGQLTAVSESVCRRDDGSCHMDAGMCSHPIAQKKRWTFMFCLKTEPVISRHQGVTESMSARRPSNVPLMFLRAKASDMI